MQPPIIVAHRINTLENLALLDSRYGVEIDIRGYGEKILLNHDPLIDQNSYVELEDYLKQATTQGISFYIFNIKEAGYEEQVINLAEKYGIPKEKYFLLDVEPPYLYSATHKKGIREIAVRYSEAEPIEMAERQIIDGKTMLDWIWIDTNTRLPLDEEKDGGNIVARLMKFKTALVCPDRWGRPEDIDDYAEEIKAKGLKLDMIMTSVSYIKQWEKHFK